MACKSPSLEKVVKKTDAAKAVVVKLQKQLESLQIADEAEFNKRKNDLQSNLGVSDFKEANYSTTVKVEYSHEFSLDLLVPIITESIQLIASTLAPGSAGLKVLTSPDAINSYISLVTSIAEAAKSSSSADAAVSFNANKLAPGAWSLIATRSTSIRDKDTFGEESVTATLFQYGLYTSVENAKNEVAYSLVLNSATAIVKLSDAKTLYLNKLLKEDISVAQYSALSQQIDNLIDLEKNKIASIGTSENSVNTLMSNAFEDAEKSIGYLNDDLANAYLLTAEERESVLMTVIEGLEGKSSLYQFAIKDALILLKNPIF
ncbi:hypothetical protein [Reichenbachiella versicolor]|uniref:hypothetical protein n=1 Tax=Reichenbachiella versicolor TaxID=1821036 RepID=UPI000D6E577C|nr:hypothetical protein [Reichenbachiella versicolor]